MIRLAATIAGIAFLSSCGHMSAAPSPLYEGPVRAARELAILSGPVAKVDGIDVSSRAASFSLLPGCHVVTLQSQIGEGGVSGAWSTDIRRRVFAFRMKAGHGYSIDVRLLPGNHSVGTANVGGVKVVAIEQDSQGKRIATIPPASGEADIEACQAWAAREERQSAHRAEASPEEAAAAAAGPTEVPAEPTAAPAEPTAAPAEPTAAPAEPAATPAESDDEPGGDQPSRP
jgi:hypothetical protein